MRDGDSVRARVQIGLVDEHRGEDERRHRLDERNAPFAVALLGEQLDQAVDEHMQKIGLRPFVNQYDAGRELLQQRGIEQALEMPGLHLAEQREAFQLGEFVVAQRRASVIVTFVNLILRKS